MNKHEKKRFTRKQCADKEEKVCDDKYWIKIRNGILNSCPFAMATLEHGATHPVIHPVLLDDTQPSCFQTRAGVWTFSWTFLVGLRILSRSFLQTKSRPGWKHHLLDGGNVRGVTDCATKGGWEWQREWQEVESVEVTAEWWRRVRVSGWMYMCMVIYSR